MWNAYNNAWGWGTWGDVEGTNVQPVSPADLMHSVVIIDNKTAL